MIQYSRTLAFLEKLFECWIYQLLKLMISCFFLLSISQPSLTLLLISQTSPLLKMSGLSYKSLPPFPCVYLNPPHTLVITHKHILHRWEQSPPSVELISSCLYLKCLKSGYTYFKSDYCWTPFLIPVREKKRYLNSRQLPWWGWFCTWK